MCLALMAGHPQRFSPSARPAGPSCQATFGHGATTPQHPPPIILPGGRPISP